MTITFPSDYSLSSPTCISVTINSNPVVGYSCSTSGNTVTVTNAFASLSNLSVFDAQLVLGNIVNPTPALYTG